MLGQRRRRWASINPALVQRLVFAGNSYLIERNKTAAPGQGFLGPAAAERVCQGIQQDRVHLSRHCGT